MRVGSVVSFISVLCKGLSLHDCNDCCPISEKHAGDGQGDDLSVDASMLSMEYVAHGKGKACKPEACC